MSRLTGAERPAPEVDSPEEGSRDPATEERVRALAALEGLDEKEARRLAGARRAESSDDGAARLWESGSRLYFHRLGAPAVELVASGLSRPLFVTAPAGDTARMALVSCFEWNITDGGIR